MDPEEKERAERIDRQLEFLANHQAHLTASLERLSADVEGLKEIAARVTDVLVSLTRVFEERESRVDEQLLRLAQAQEKTDQRLNTLITVVERYFSNGRK